MSDREGSGGSPPRRDRAHAGRDRSPAGHEEVRRAARAAAVTRAQAGGCPKGHARSEQASSRCQVCSRVALKRSSGRLSFSFFVSVVLPAPLGDERMSMTKSEGSVVTRETKAAGQPTRPSGPFHSTFCACSRMRSISVLSATTACEIGASCAFAPSVLASRAISWRKKSSFRPHGPPAGAQRFARCESWRSAAVRATRNA